jgi:hypothetical protein
VYICFSFGSNYDIEGWNPGRPPRSPAKLELEVCVLTVCKIVTHSLRVLDIWSPDIMRLRDGEECLVAPAAA